jgi:carbon starvation protein CstA
MCVFCGKRHDIQLAKFRRTVAVLECMTYSTMGSFPDLLFPMVGLLIVLIVLIVLIMYILSWRSLPPLQQTQLI